MATASALSRSSLLTLLLLGLFAGAMWQAISQLDYRWQWRSLQPHLLAEHTQDLRPPMAATVLELSPLKLELVDGQPWDCTPCEAEPELEVGAQVWPEERVATRSRWQFGLLLQGLWLTLEVSLLAIACSLVPGLALAALRMQSAPLPRWTGIALIEIIRGTPLLVQIFLFYFLVGSVLGLERLTAGVTALALFTAAYVAEIVRGAIASVPRGQWEAAKVLGLSPLQSLIHVIFPQALPRMLPALAGQFILLVKDSSLLSVIALTDLTKAGREIVAATFAPFEVWLTVAALYLSLTLSLGSAVRWWEGRIRRRYD